jgi:GMP synthase-like glutamine amidotransferase
MSCQDQVEVLPPDSEVLAGSEHCPIGLFRHGRMLGLQGHPEFPPEYARALLGFRRERIGTAIADQAVQTLDEQTHSVELSRWITNFLAGSRRVTAS